MENIFLCVEFDQSKVTTQPCFVPPYKDCKTLLTPLGNNGGPIRDHPWTLRFSITVWCFRGFRGAPMVPRDGSFSDGSTPDRCSFLVWGRCKASREYSYDFFLSQKFYANYKVIILELYHYKIYRWIYFEYSTNLTKLHANYKVIMLKLYYHKRYRLIYFEYSTRTNLN